jgi:hypothetical protein
LKKALAIDPFDQFFSQNRGIRMLRRNFGVLSPLSQIRHDIDFRQSDWHNLSFDLKMGHVAI